MFSLELSAFTLSSNGTALFDLILSITGTFLLDDFISSTNGTDPFDLTGCIKESTVIDLTNIVELPAAFLFSAN